MTILDNYMRKLFLDRNIGIVFMGDDGKVSCDLQPVHQDRPVTRYIIWNYDATRDPKDARLVAIRNGSEGSYGGKYFFSPNEMVEIFDQCCHASLYKGDLAEMKQDKEVLRLGRLLTPEESQAIRKAATDGKRRLLDRLVVETERAAYRIQ